MSAGRIVAVLYGLVCNFSGKLLRGTFSGPVVQFFLQPPCLETPDEKFFPLYSDNFFLSAGRIVAVLYLDEL